MSSSNLYKAIQYVAEIVEICKARGLTLDVSTDFQEYRRVRAAQPERTNLSPMYDAACSYVDWTNGFWIKGVDENGDIVHTQAVRLLELSGISLAEHLQQHRHLYASPGIEGDPTLFAFAPTPTCQKITGRVCYHGDLWLKEGSGTGFRGKGLTTVLPRMAMALSVMEWSADYIFGFMYPFMACKGLAAREGYLHMEPGVWQASGESETVAEWLVWMAREDIKYLMQFPPSELYQQLQDQERSKRQERSKMQEVTELPEELRLASEELRRPRRVAVS